MRLLWSRMGITVLLINILSILLFTLANNTTGIILARSDTTGILYIEKDIIINSQDQGEQYIHISHNREISNFTIENIDGVSSQEMCDIISSTNNIDLTPTDGFELASCMNVSLVNFKTNKLKFRFHLGGQFDPSITFDYQVAVMFKSLYINKGEHIPLFSLHSILEKSIQYQLSGSRVYTNDIIADHSNLYTPLSNLYLDKFNKVFFSFSTYNLFLFKELFEKTKSKFNLSIDSSEYEVLSNNNEESFKYVTFYNCTTIITDAYNNHIMGSSNNQPCSPKEDLTFQNYFSFPNSHDVNYSLIVRQCRCYMYISPFHQNNDISLIFNQNVQYSTESLGHKTFQYLYSLPSFQNQHDIGSLTLTDTTLSFDSANNNTVRNYHISADLTYYGNYIIKLEFPNSKDKMEIISVKEDPSPDNGICSVTLQSNSFNLVLPKKHNNQLNFKKYCKFIITTDLSPFNYSKETTLTLTNPSFKEGSSKPITIKSYTADFASHGIVGMMTTNVSSRLRLTLTDTVLTPNTVLSLTLTQSNFGIGTDASKDKEKVKLDEIYVSCEPLPSVNGEEPDPFRERVNLYNTATVTRNDKPDPYNPTLSLNIRLTDQEHYTPSHTDSPLFCDVVLPYQLNANTVYTFYLDDITTIKKTTNNTRYMFGFNSNNQSKPNYKTGVTELIMGVTFTNTGDFDLGLFHTALIIENSFKATKAYNCTQINESLDTSSSYTTPLTSLGTTHYVLQLAEFSLNQSDTHTIQISCLFANSDKYITEKKSAVSLFLFDSLPSLRTVASSNYQQLSQTTLDKLSGPIHFNITVVPNTNIPKTKSTIVKVDWTDLESKVNMKLGQAADAVFRAAKSLIPQLTVNDMFKLDLTVNGVNSVKTSDRKETTSIDSLSQSYEDLEYVSTGFQVTSQQQNRYSASFGFDSGFNFNLNDLRTAINNQLSQNDDLQDMSTSTILDDIISQCLDAGYGCGALCAPCTGSDACKSDSDCITGVCSFNQCQAYDTEKYFGNSAVNMFTYQSLIFSTILFIFFNIMI